MPTPMPIIVASCTPKSGTSSTLAISHTPPSATPSPNAGDHQRQAGGQRRAERHQQDDQGRHQADRLGAGLRLLDLLDRVAAQLDAQRRRPRQRRPGPSPVRPTPLAAARAASSNRTCRIPGRAVGRHRPGLGRHDVVDRRRARRRAASKPRGVTSGPVPRRRPRRRRRPCPRRSAGKRSCSSSDRLGRVAARHREVDLVVAAGDAGEHRSRPPGPRSTAPRRVGGGRSSRSRACGASRHLLASASLGPGGVGAQVASLVRMRARIGPRSEAVVNRS